MLLIFTGRRLTRCSDLAFKHGVLKRGEGREYPGSDEKTLHLLSDGTRLPESAVASYENIFRDILEEEDEENESDHVVESRSLCEVVTEDFLEEASDGEEVVLPPGYTKLSTAGEFSVQ